MNPFGPLQSQRVAVEDQGAPVRRIVQPIATVNVRNTETMIYTAGAQFDFLIRNLWASKVLSGSAELTMWMVPASGGTSAANMWFLGKTITSGAGPTMLAHDAMLRPLLQPGMSLVATSSVDEGINVGGWGQDFFGGEV